MQIGNDALNQFINSACFLENGSITACNEHHKGDKAHHRDAAGDVIVQFTEKEGAAKNHDQKTDQSGQRQRLPNELNHYGQNNGQKRCPVLEFKLLDFLGLGFHADDRAVFVVTRFTIKHKDCNQQTDQHGGTENPVDGGDVRHRGLHAALSHAVSHDALEDQTETNGQRDVRSLQAEAKRTSHRTAVKLHLVHQIEQRRNQQRNEGNVHRHHVLRQAGNGGQNETEDRRTRPQMFGNPGNKHLH